MSDTDALWAAHYAYTRSYKRMDLEDGLTALEHLMLQCIHNQQAISIAGLATGVHRDVEPVTVVIRRLTASGLVSLTRSASDRRHRQIKLTTAGRAVVRHTPASSPVHSERH